MVPSPTAALAALGVSTLLGLPSTLSAQASTLDAIRQLENLINASGTETLVSGDCPPQHAGYYENDGRGIDRLVICRRHIDLGDVEAVWEVMAHEATHIMQACSGGAVISDAMMPRTVRELQSLAPHYAKLIASSYSRGEQRLEAEAFWMELQPASVVIALFRRTCAAFLEPGAASRRRSPPPLPTPLLMPLPAPVATPLPAPLPAASTQPASSP